ncbi:hypothetical protein ACQWU4_04180 [Chryseobacterium sp. MIQD13]|uniref:hypothetical protein n=1 Tax=Chryseobacterium sp. MIQD13 TaxID=3422310 RepID=UPI003D2A3348
MDIKQKKIELIESYIAPFKIEKQELIDEISEHIKHYFNETPECLYEIREFINLRDSKFSQSVILTQPRLFFMGHNISNFEGPFLAETYSTAQKILEEFKTETNDIYKNLVEIVIKKIEKEEKEQNS